jgi:hypothetical protein
MLMNILLANLCSIIALQQRRARSRSRDGAQNAPHQPKAKLSRKIAFP